MNQSYYSLAGPSNLNYQTTYQTPSQTLPTHPFIQQPYAQTSHIPSTSSPEDQDRPSGSGTGSISTSPSLLAGTDNLRHPISGLGPLVEPHQELNEFLETFWGRQMENVEGDSPDFKTYPLPLARIKKVMKSDEEVKMISAEAPIMFSKACEVFISELTCRAWLIAESHKRRTLQKSDVAAAIAFSDMFDFLIDVVPRDEGEAEAEQEANGTAEGGVEGEIDIGDSSEMGGEVDDEANGRGTKRKAEDSDLDLDRRSGAGFGRERYGHLTNGVKSESQLGDNPVGGGAYSVGVDDMGFDGHVNGGVGASHEENGEAELYSEFVAGEEESFA